MSEYGKDFPHRFPITRLSAIEDLSAADIQRRKRALDILASTYWRPVYAYIRMKWNRNTETAKDLTQAFFASVIEKEYLHAYDPSQARFRTFLRTCIDRFIQNVDRADGRIKRGGEAQLVSFDLPDDTDDFPAIDVADPRTPEDRFELEWIRSLYSLSVERLREKCETEGKQLQFKAFKRYDLDRVESDDDTTYAAIAEELAIDTTTLNNYLSAMRRTFRSIVLDILAQITATDKEFREEARIVLGVDIDE